MCILGITSTVWKIMIVQDDLEEAPIEQLQVILSDPENCLIDHNRTIVSIYDLDRGKYLISYFNSVNSIICINV